MWDSQGNYWNGDPSTESQYPYSYDPTAAAPSPTEPNTNPAPTTTGGDPVALAAEGQTVQQIAAKTGMTEAQVQSALSAAGSNTTPTTGGTQDPSTLAQIGNWLKDPANAGLIKGGVTAATLLAASQQKSQDPAVVAQNLYNTNHALAHTPVTITNQDGTKRTFDPYGSISVLPMARQQQAYTGNPTGAGLPTATGAPTQSFQTPHLASGGAVPSTDPNATTAYVPQAVNPNYVDSGNQNASIIPASTPAQTTPTNLAWLKTPPTGFAGGGAVAPTAAELNSMGQSGDYTGLENYLTTTGMDANTAASWYNNLMGTNLTGAQVDKNMGSVGYSLPGETPYMNYLGQQDANMHPYVPPAATVAPATQRLSGAPADQFNNFISQADYGSAYQMAKNMGYSDSDFATYINQQYGQTIPNVNSWIKSYTGANTPPPQAITTEPIIPTPGSTNGGSGNVNTLPTVAPMNQQRSQIPYQGDFTHYGQGPEHLFYNKVNPLYGGPGSVWDPSATGANQKPTQSNENLSYIPPTTGPVGSSVQPTNAFTQGIANGQYNPSSWQAQAPVVPSYPVQPPYGTTGGYTPVAKATGGAIQPGLSTLQAHGPRMQGHIQGPGTGQSDSIPAVLSNGEYVMDADTVANLGDGSTDAGAKALDKMRQAVRAHKRSAPISQIPPKAKPPMAYLKGGKI